MGDKSLLHPVATGWIKSNQGLEDNSTTPATYYSAGNQFSYSAFDVENDGGKLIYYFYNPSGFNQTPQLSSGIQGNVAPPNGCSTTYCVPPCHPIEELNGIKNDYYVNQGAYQVVKNHSGASPTAGDLTLLAYYQHVMDNDAYTIVMHILYDTTGYNPDTLKKWIGNLNSVEGSLWLAQEYLSDGNVSSSIALLNQALSTGNLMSYQQSDLINYKSIINLLNGHSLYSLDLATQQSLEAYISAGGYSENWTKSILALYGRPFQSTYVTSVSSQNRSDLVKPLSINRENWLAVHPNPARESVFFTFALPQNSSSVSLRVFDVNGKIVFAKEGILSSQDLVWETKSIQSGIYIYQVLLESAVLQNGKIVLTK
jgi:hypothetical protein